MAAPSNGASASRTFPRSVLGRKTWVCPAKNNARNPSPAKAKEECPEGKLLHPSWRVWWSTSVQTSMVTSLFSGVPGVGLHREMRSGRGLPTAFLITSVIKEVRIKLAKNQLSPASNAFSTNPIKNPSIVTCHLCRFAFEIPSQSARDAHGTTPAYIKFQKTGTLSCNACGYCRFMLSMKNMRWKGSCRNSIWNIETIRYLLFNLEWQLGTHTKKYAINSKAKPK